MSFLQRAFTISFRGGVFYVNNNLVGLGKSGNGFGLDAGFYDSYKGAVEIGHDVDGKCLLEVCCKQ